jgi:hypothetical protein
MRIKPTNFRMLGVSAKEKKGKEQGQKSLERSFNSTIFFLWKKLSEANIIKCYVNPT